mgnify:CR=1 FL=1
MSLSSAPVVFVCLLGSLVALGGLVVGLVSYSFCLVSLAVLLFAGVAACCE